MQQKLVDTLICCDLLSLCTDPGTSVFLVSDDDDFVPALLLAGLRVRPSGTSAQSLIRFDYTTTCWFKRGCGWPCSEGKTMTTEEIRADIAAFADDEESVLIDKSFIVFQRERQEYWCRLVEPAPGQVDIEVNDRRMPYYRFLAEELGRLSILAESIRQKRKDVVPLHRHSSRPYELLG